MEITFNRIVRASRAKQALAKRAVEVASAISGIQSPRVEFFEMVAPTRAPDVIVTEVPALGFYTRSAVFVRNDLGNSQTIKTCFHETSHASQQVTARRTLRVLSDNASEREARLFCLEHLSGLRHDASEKEAIVFLDRLEKRFKQQLRERCAALVKQANQRFIAMNRIKAVNGVEYR